ncbi:putative mediator of RNA polymerase II transcription subunit 26 [Mercenaria mercenaria]|uniref:putative mediator of RNA polymerase II transcription subunit 26 n=1 Tax=Mercenaria mercenaria TaxID=6596 RepID=UPI00234F26D2|nr:putative mediator of RNA polymerase II transcription subunit 26 [Mercenaria mercenaria]
MEFDNTEFMYYRDFDDDNTLSNAFAGINSLKAIQFMKTQRNNENWYSDSLSSTIVDIIEKHEQINVRLKTTSLTDILAGIRFDARRDGSGPLHGEKLFEKFDPKRYDEGLTDVDPILIEADIPNNPLLKPGHNEITNALFEDDRKQNSIWKDNVVRYNNPFDPRLTFQGLQFGQTADQHNYSNEDQIQDSPDAFNCFLDIVNPSGFANTYFNKYQQFLRDLRGESKKLANNDSFKVSGQKDKAQHIDNIESKLQTNEEKVEPAPYFVGNECENIDMWSQINATRRFWSEDIQREQPHCLTDDYSTKSVLVALFSKSSEDLQCHSSKQDTFTNSCETDANVKTEIETNQSESEISKQQDDTHEKHSKLNHSPAKRSRILSRLIPLEHDTCDSVIPSIHPRTLTRENEGSNQNTEEMKNRLTPSSEVEDKTETVQKQDGSTKDSTLPETTWIANEAGDFTVTNDKLSNLDLKTSGTAFVSHSYSPWYTVSVECPGKPQVPAQTSMFWSHQQRCHYEIQQQHHHHQQQQQQQEMRQNQHQQQLWQQQKQQVQLDQQQKHHQHQNQQQPLTENQQQLDHHQQQSQKLQSQQQKAQQQKQLQQKLQEQQTQQQHKLQLQQQQQQTQKHQNLQPQQPQQQQKLQQQQPQIQQPQQQQKLQQQQTQKHPQQPQHQQKLQQQPQPQHQLLQQQAQQQQQIKQKQPQQQQKFQQQQPQQLQQQQTLQQQQPQQQQKLQQQQTQQQQKLQPQQLLQKQTLQQEQPQQHQKIHPQQPQQQQKLKQQQQQQQRTQQKAQQQQQKQCQQQQNSQQQQPQQQQQYQQQQELKQQQPQQHQEQQQQQPQQQPQQPSQYSQYQWAFQQQYDSTHNQNNKRKYDHVQCSNNQEQWTDIQQDYEQTHNTDQLDLLFNLQHHPTSGQQTQYYTQNNGQPVNQANAYYHSVHPQYATPAYMNSNQCSANQTRTADQLNVGQQTAFPAASFNWQSQQGINYGSQPYNYPNVYYPPPGTAENGQVLNLNFVHSRPQHHDIKFDDEVWYINGVPHQHAKPLQQNVSDHVAYSPNLGVWPPNYNWNANVPPPTYTSTHVHQSTAVNLPDLNNKHSTKQIYRSHERMQDVPTNLNNNNDVEEKMNKCDLKDDFAIAELNAASESWSSDSLSSSCSNHSLLTLSDVTTESSKECCIGETPDSLSEFSDTEEEMAQFVSDKTLGIFDIGKKCIHYPEDCLAFDNQVNDGNCSSQNKKSEEMTGRHIKVLSGRAKASRERLKPQRKPRSFRASHLINII